MVEVIVFLILSLILLVFLIISYLKKKNKKLIISLIISLLSNLVFLIYFIIQKELNNIFRILFITFSLFIPLVNILLVGKEYSFKEAITLFIVNLLLFFKNSKLAKKVIINFLKNKPHSFQLRKKLGNIFKKEGGIRKALNEYIIAINLKQDSKLYLEVAHIFYDLGNIEDARDCLIYILSKEQDFLDGHLFLAEIYLELEKNKEAANTLNDALKSLKDKGDFNIYFKLGEIYCKLNDFKSSKENFQKAYDINPKDILLFYIGQIYLIENEEEKAIENLKEILDNKNLRPYVLYELARIAVYRCENKKAISYINEAVKLEERLKERALNDHIFLNIKDEFIFSVKLNEEEIEVIKEKLIEEKVDKNIFKNISKNLKVFQKDKPNILQKLKFVEEKDEELTETEISIIKYFSDISSTITNMGDISSQEKTKNTVDRIFKQKLGQIEVENHILNEQLKDEK